MYFFFCLFLVGSPVSAETEADAVLDRLMSREWKRLAAEQPLLAIYLGENSERVWPDNSLGQRGRTYAHYGAVIEELDKISPSALSPSQQINQRLFRQQLQWQRSYIDNNLDFMAINQREGLHTLATLASSIDFREAEDYRRWVERLETFDAYAEREQALLAEAVRLNRVHPKIIAQRILKQVKAQPPLHKNPEESPFYKPFQQADSNLQTNQEFLELSARARVAIQEKVGPSYQKFAEFLESEYLPAAPEKIGLGRLPGGERAYKFLIGRYTTTDMTAEEVHQLGLREVARIRGLMERIKTEVGFEGTLEQFFQHLRTSPEHYVKDPLELLMRYRSFCKRVDGQMPKLFKTLPRKPYGVEPIPDYIAPETTTAYYLPGAGDLAGTYSVNLYKPETRALFEIPALSLHESVPGHHHQIALAQELPNLPAFRRESAGFGDYTVFVEGWALYAESLGEEMGLYEDPYDLFGRYTYEMWRAIRLVLDTGIHTKGWTRRQSIDYFLQNSPRSELDITNEVDRYISWPGQALAYKMGELEIKRLRRKAEQALGENFDIRTFHDAVLRQGAVPLNQLEKQINEYLKD